MSSNFLNTLFYSYLHQELRPGYVYLLGLKIEFGYSLCFFDLESLPQFKEIDFKMKKNQFESTELIFECTFESCGELKSTKQIKLELGNKKVKWCFSVIVDVIYGYIFVSYLVNESSSR